MASVGRRRWCIWFNTNLVQNYYFFNTSIHGIGWRIQASEALQIKIQASCPHNCQVGELYAPTFDHVSFTLLYFVLTFDLLCYINHFALSTCTEVDIAEIKWINRKSITSIGVSCDHCKEVQMLTRNNGSEFFTFETNQFELNLHCRSVSNSWMHIDSICIWHLQKVQILRASSKYPTWTPQTTFALHQIP